MWVLGSKVDCFQLCLVKDVVICVRCWTHAVEKNTHFMYALFIYSYIGHITFDV